jgi:shikimate 5-dehydrogenase
LTEAGAKLAVTGRNLDRVRMFSKSFNATPYSAEQAEMADFDAVVNATPLGMAPHVDECFFQKRIPANLVFDMVYNPLDTKLLQWAKAEGKTVLDGLHMFLEQAALQFELWTGEDAPRGPMERAAREALQTKS